MSTGDVVCTGWLIKSPPEKKLKRYAWRKRWFVLRRGRMNGDLDVLEYYRTKTSRKPIRSIDLRECEVKMQTDVHLIKREFQNQHLFVVKTLSRIYYLVAKTEEEMNSWICNISQICHFSPVDDGTGSMDSFSHTQADLQRSPASSSHAAHIPSLDLATDANTLEDSQSESECSLAPDYLVLSQCETGRVSGNRQVCNSCSNSERSLEQDSVDNVAEDICHSSVSPFPPAGPVELPFSASNSSTPLSRAADFSSSTSSPMSDVFQFEKSPCALSPCGSTDERTPPPRPPKPRRFSERCMDEMAHYVALKSCERLFPGQPAPIPRRISLAGLDHIRRETNKQAFKKWYKLYVLFQPPVDMGSSPSSADCYEESYVPMNSGTSPAFSTLESPPDGYIPMSPTSVKFLLSSEKTKTSLSATPLQVLPKDLEPPPVNRDLKPRRRVRPPPLDLRGLSTIRECPFHLPLMRTLTEPGCSTNWCSMERQCEAGATPPDCEENCLALETRSLLHPISASSALHFPRKSNLDYLSLDFNSASPSPVQKKALLADEQRVDYVQVDKKKTQALQNTKMDWKDFRQSKE
ncbi:GRB2-associated-binding protein 3-like [Arapaima gigas]